jgi:SH3-like domain-containing protein
MSGFAATISRESSSASVAGVSGNAVVAEAKKFLGFPYAYSGDRPSTGFSCIGFVSYVYRQLGVRMGGDLGTAMSQFPVVPESQLLPGDIIFFQNTWWPGVSHVGIYIGHGKIIHAEDPQNGVTINMLVNDPRSGNYYQDHYLQAERPWNGPAVGHPGHYLVVIVSTLNVRSDHYFSAGVVTVLVHGQRVHVQGWAPGWERVKTADGTIGWVVRSGVARSKGGVSTPPSNTSGKSSGSTTSRARRAAWANAKTIYVYSLRVHSAPALSAPVVAMLSRGNRVGVFVRRGGWDKILLVNGTVGWAMAQYVGRNVPSKKGGSHPGHLVGHTPLRAGVNLRSSPSMNASIVAVTNGSPVRVLHWARGWADVKLSTGASGWVWRAFLGHKR